MNDDYAWKLTTWAGNRRRQQELFMALPFREKLQRLEEMAEVADRLGRSPRAGDGDGGPDPQESESR